MYRYQAIFHWMVLIILICMGVMLTPPAEATVTVFEVPCGPDQDAEVLHKQFADIRHEVHAECSTQSTVEVSFDLPAHPFRPVVDVVVREDAPGIRECALQGIRTDLTDTHKVECKNESYKVEALVETWVCVDLISAYEKGETAGVGACQAWLFNPEATTCSLLSCPQLFDIWENCINDPDRSHEECIDIAVAAWTEHGGGRTPEECGICPAP